MYFQITHKCIKIRSLMISMSYHLFKTRVSNYVFKKQTIIKENIFNKGYNTNFKTFY